MKKATVEETQKSLQNLADQVGAKRYEVAKALILEDLIIVDAEGNPVDPASINYEVTLSAGAPMEASADTDEAPEKSLAVEVAKAVREEIAIARAESTPTRKAVTVTAPKMFSRLKSFKSADEAYRFGSWAHASLGNKKSAQWCSDNGIVIKANNEGSSSAGGFLVPEEFSNTLITLRETFGVIRQHARIFPMTSDILRIPRRATNLTAYFVGEAAAGTQSDETFQQINLVAKKSMVLNKVSSELNEDSMISWADDLASEMSYAQASIEDTCAFVGDGSSTHGGMLGLASAVGSAGTHTPSAGSSTFALITLANISAAFALLPQYADNSNTKIFCSKAAWNGVFLRLAAVAAGNTQSDLLSGDKKLSFLGYPVVICQKMNATSSASKIVAHMGDMSQAAYLGSRRDMNVEFSNSALNSFEQDQLVYRATTRWDFVAANVGDTSVAGSIVTLTTSAS